jgi:EAL domain-containing protein (putative c-di-GMP-specific phosphodiesterase class I)
MFGRLSLLRRIALLIAAVLLPALAGSWLVHTQSLRTALAQQLVVRNADAAAALALALSQQGGDLVAMQTVAAAQFDLGAYRSIVLRTTAGATPTIEQRAATTAQPVHAPAWFTAAFAIDAAPGRAAVSAGWQALGTLEVQAHAAWAHDALWQAAVRSAWLLVVLAGLAALGIALALRGWQRPLAAAVAQAEALEQGRFVTAPEPALPELRQLTRAMNRSAQRLQELFAQQAAQVAQLERAAHQDPVTGLPARRQFLGLLQRLIDGTAPAASPAAPLDSGPSQPASGPGAGLILLRVPDLERLNHRDGHATTDERLRALAALLGAFVQRAPGCLAGRLNGGDFALVLPVAGQAGDSARALAGAAGQHPALRDLALHIAAVDGLGGQVAEAGAALALADRALAEAEGGAGVVVVDAAAAPAEAALARGERHWRERITAALAEGRVRIAEHPVLARDGQLLHLECPLRVQLVPGGGYEAAARWLALARRSRLLPQVDLAVLRLALTASAGDGRPRGVHIAPASLQHPGFVAAVQAELAAQPVAAARLWIEWSTGGQSLVPAALRDATLAWRLYGVKLGIEHAGADAQSLAAMHEAGLDYVKIDARHLRGIADDAAVRRYAQGLATLVHGLGWIAIAEGVTEASELPLLWEAGYDGATGPAVGEGAPGSATLS